MKSELTGLLLEYLTYLKSVRGCSEKTIESYGNDLSRYANYCVNHEIIAEKAEPYEVQKFIADLSAEEMAGTSVNRSLSALRGFYRWMARTGKREDNPCGSLRNIKAPVKLPSVLWEKEMASFADLPDSSNNLWPARDKALILAIYSAGLRISEAVSLSKENVSSKLEEAKITGKGGKERFVFFSSEAREAFTYYLAERTAILAKTGKDGRSGAFFINKKGRPISVSGVRWIISSYAHKLELGKNIHPHTLRHSFATHLVNSGCDVRIVQEMLGHASLSTTQRYTHVNIENLKRVYMASHPHGSPGTRKSEAKK